MRQARWQAIKEGHLTRTRPDQGPQGIAGGDCTRQRRGNASGGSCCIGSREWPWSWRGPPGWGVTDIPDGTGADGARVARVRTPRGGARLTVPGRLPAACARRAVHPSSLPSSPPAAGSQPITPIKVQRCTLIRCSPARHQFEGRPARHPRAFPPGELGLKLPVIHLGRHNPFGAVRSSPGNWGMSVGRLSDSWRRFVVTLTAMSALRAGNMGDGSRLVAAAQGRQVNGSPSRNRSHDRQQGG